MHPVRKQRLYMVIFVVMASSVAIGLILYSLGENLNSFYPPSQIVSGEAPKDKTIRAGGCVVPGSIEQDNESLRIYFKITDGMDEIRVTYEGITPDLFSEGEAAIVTGKVDESLLFTATKLLAKHDETYMPREVSDTLEETTDGTENHSASCKGMF